MTVRFGLLGLDHHYNAFPTLEAIARSPDAEVLALAHRDEGEAREVGERFGVRVVPGYDDVLALDAVDVVCTFTSADESAAVALQAIEAGKAVVAIKPMAMTLDEADTVVDAVHRAGARYFPHDCARRLGAANVQIHAWAEEGRIGEVVAGYCVFRAGLPRRWPGADEPGWFADPARVPGGAFIDHAIYHVDVLRWLLGAEVESVLGMTANVRQTDLAVEDFGHAVLRFRGGKMGSIEDTWTSGPGRPKEALELVGTLGSMTYDTTTGRLSATGDFGFDGWVHLAPPPSRGGFIDHVIRCMRGEEAPISSADEARANLAACLAFYESAREGRVVEVARPPTAT